MANMFLLFLLKLGLYLLLKVHMLDGCHTYPAAICNITRAQYQRNRWVRCSKNVL